MTRTHPAAAETPTTAQHALRFPNGERLLLGGACRARVMGILNITPDSFSDGGRFFDADRAVAQAERMAEEGADLIDVGGESTRPGSDPVSAEEEARRIIPVIERVVARTKVPVSVDTTRATTAEKALDAGAQMVNDVSALRADARMGPLVAERGAPVALMHMLGTPKTMQTNPTYDDVVSDIRTFLAGRVAAAEAFGIPREQIVIDPGFGFGKTLEHNLELLRRLDEFAELRLPVMIGTSRKSMLGRILDAAPDERVNGTSATTAVAVERGAVMVRVHDVRPALDVVKVMAAVQGRAWS